MKKITFLMLHLGYGGAEQAVIAQANLLVEKYNVEIISFYKLYENPAFEVDPRIEIKYLTENVKPNREEIKKAISAREVGKIVKEGIKSLKILYWRKYKMRTAIRECDSDVIISSRYIYHKLLTKNAPEKAVCIAQEHNHHNGNEKYIRRQIQAIKDMDYFMPVSSVAVYGGNDGVLFEQQKKGLSLGADVVIATPGRLIAHLSLGYVDLSKVSYFILDEADRMLDMGFYEDIMQIVKYLPKERQTIMFSATMPAKIQQLAKTILNNPVEVKLAVSKPAEKIVQAAYVCYENQKLGIVRSLFAEEVPERVIIFASSKIKVKEVAKALKMMKLNVGEMHSDLEQESLSCMNLSRVESIFW